MVDMDFFSRDQFEEKFKSTRAHVLFPIYFLYHHLVMLCHTKTFLARELLLPWNGRFFRYASFAKYPWQGLQSQ